jgi:Ala-tRNA(Pro) deacylase
MPIAGRLKEFLEKEGVDYESSRHAEAYTAQEVAASAHVPGRELAKTVIGRKSDGSYVMIVVPAPFNVDFRRVSEELEDEVELAKEEEFRNLFPDCEAGAMPPFGNLYGLPVYADRRLKEDEKLTFNAGTHRDAMTIRYRDFERLARPKYLTVSIPANQ